MISGYSDTSYPTSHGTPLLQIQRPQDYSGSQLQTTTQKIIVKMEIDENPRKPEDQEVERGVLGGNRNLKGVAFS